MISNYWYGNQNTLQVVLFVILCTLTIKYLLGKFRRNSKFEKLAATLPGPPTFPLIGNGLEFLFHGIGDFGKIFAGYSQKYGSIYRLWIGKDLIVSLSDIELVEAVYRSPKAIGRSKLFNVFEDVWKNSIVTAHMDLWRITRKQIQPIFSKSAVKLQIPTINKSVEKYVNLMKKELNGPEFDLNDYIPHLATDSLTKIHFNLELDYDENKRLSLHHGLYLAGQCTIFGIFVPLFRIDFIRHLYFKKHSKTVTDRLKKYMNMVNNTKQPEEVEIDEFSLHSKTEIKARSLLSVTRQIEKDLKIDNYVYDEITSFISAGADTTNTTVSFFLLLVAMHPHIQNKLYEEISEIFDKNHNTPLTMDDLQNFSYLDQVLKESMRRFTLAPAIFKGVSEDIEIGPMSIPSETTLMIGIGNIHLNPDIYPNPLEFNPENFNPEAISKRSKYSFMPFSMGSRDCIAKIYGETVSKLMLIKFLRNFEFHTTTEMENIELYPGFPMGKKGGYWVSITPRKRKTS